MRKCSGSVFVITTSRETGMIMLLRRDRVIAMTTPGVATANALGG